MNRVNQTPIIIKSFKNYAQLQGAFCQMPVIFLMIRPLHTKRLSSKLDKMSCFEIILIIIVKKEYEEGFVALLKR